MCVPERIYSLEAADKAVMAAAAFSCCDKCKSAAVVEVLGRQDEPPLLLTPSQLAQLVRKNWTELKSSVPLGYMSTTLKRSKTASHNSAHYFRVHEVLPLPSQEECSNTVHNEHRNQTPPPPPPTPNQASKVEARGEIRACRAGQIALLKVAVVVVFAVINITMTGRLLAGWLNKTSSSTSSSYFFTASIDNDGKIYIDKLKLTRRHQKGRR